MSASGTKQWWQTLAASEIRRAWWQPEMQQAPRLPVLAARGARPGPLVVITGAVHGDEYEGPAAIHALFNTLDSAHLAGTVIGLPVVNGPAWEARTRISPVDQLDLNRLFPATSAPDTQASQTPSRTLAAVVFEHFVQPCDVLIDLHSGGAKLVHLPMIGWYVDGGDAERIGRSFDQAMHPWRPGTVPGVLSYEAHRAGKVALGAEWGGGARLDPAGVAAYASGLRRALTLLAGDTLETPFVDTRGQLVGSYQQTAQGGLFCGTAALGQPVTPETTLGHLYNPLGEVLGEIKAERAGTLAAVAHVALLSPGDRMAYIG